MKNESCSSFRRICYYNESKKRVVGDETKSTITVVEEVLTVDFTLKTLFSTKGLALRYT